MITTRVALLMFCCFTSLHCAMLRRAPAPERIEIVLKGQPGQKNETRYYSNSRSLLYSESQLLRDKTESVEFTVGTEITGHNPAEKLLSFNVRTLQKDGVVPLHDLAFPEVNEKVEYVVRTDSAQVLRASRYSPQSVFFIPTLPMPQKAVRPGDTWVMEHDWISSHDQVPLRLQVVAIFKDIVACGKNWCADLELSGNVSFSGLVVTGRSGFHFVSRLWGRVLFDLDRGDVIWSEIRNYEDVGSAKERTLVHSCMVSELKTGARYKTPLVCEPAEKPVQAVPQF